ncbi:beta strand repeat-containing protein, partial [Halomonas huangheensis]
ETTSGVFNIDTRGDSLQSLTVNGTDVTNAGSAGITITTDLGTLTVTETDGVYSWSYTLNGSTDEHVDGGGTAADHVRDIFNLEVTDSDGDTATAKLGIDVQDDVPTAVDDTTTTGEDKSVSYNVLTNSDGTSDTQGADGAILTAASLVDDSQGTLTFEADGTVTFTPAPGFEGDALIDYTITDADGDTSTATLTVTVDADSTPEIVVPPEEPGVPDGPDPGDPDDPNDDIDLTAGDALYSVDEAGLSGGSDADADSETTSGVFNIETRGDDLQALTVNGTDVTNAGSDGITVTTDLGTLTVTETDGVYSWSYTLSDNTTDHSTVDSTDADNVRDIFNLEVTDSDGDTATAKLGIDVQDDVPTAVDDTTTTGEDEAVSYNVLTNSDGTSDTQGADGATLTHAALQNTDDGDLTFNADGTVTFTPAPGFEGDALIDYTITDADGDTSDATLTVTVDADSTPEIVVPPEEPGVPDGPDPGDPDDPNDDIDPAAGDALYTVDEAGLSGGSDADADSETTSGVFNIETRGDDLQALTVNGTDVTNAGSDGITVTTDLGTLTVTETDGVYSWSYTLNGSTDEHVDGGGTAADHVRDIFNLEVTDSDGDTATAKLGIDVLDDVPTAEDDTASIAEDSTTVTGNVTDNDTHSADAEEVAFNDPAAAQFGTFTDNGDGTWSYELDNSLAAVQALDDGETLTESLVYTVTDADGDTSEATLTITITGQTDAPPVVTPEDSDGTASSADNSVVEDSGATVTGTVTVSAEAGIAAVTVGGVDVTQASADNPIAIATTDRGSLTVTDYDAATGVISYSYTEDSDAEDHREEQVDSFDVTVTDVAGESTSGTLTVETLDTEPTAADDSASVEEDAVDPVTGTVLTNDTQSADGLGRVAFNDPTAAQYGSFTDNGDGSWSYELDNSLPAVQALDDGETLTESLVYTVTDADGDTSEATLTITITGQTDAPPVVTPEDSDGTASSADNSVVEDSGATVTGTVTVSAEAGIAAVSVGGVDVTSASADNPIAIATTERGSLTVTDYDAAT